MPVHSKRIDLGLVGKILPRKEKADVLLFIPDRKAIRERSLVASPSAPEAELLVEIRAIRIRRLMYQAFNHGSNQAATLRRGSIPIDYSRYSWHRGICYVVLYSFVTRWPGLFQSWSDTRDNWFIAPRLSEPYDF